jgi:hypothetical protein
MFIADCCHGWINLGLCALAAYAGHRFQMFVNPEN